MFVTPPPFDPMPRSNADMPKGLWVLGMVGIGLYAFLKLFFFDEARLLDSLLLIVGLVCLYRYGGPTKHSLPVWAFWAVMLAMTATWAAGLITHPEIAKSTPKFDHLGRHFLFVAFALWLMHSAASRLVVLMLFVLSVALSPWVMGHGLEEMTRGLNSTHFKDRAVFGIHNSQHTALVFGSALIAWGLLGNRAMAWVPAMWLRMVVWAGVATWLLMGVIATQTRAAYLGLAVVGLLGAIGLAIWVASDMRRRWPYAAAFFAVVAWAVWFFSGHADLLTQRFNESLPTLQMLSVGAWQNLPENSLGLRFMSWRAGYEWFIEYPWLGVGRNGAEVVMQNTPWLQNIEASQFGHMHNSLFDLLIRYGIFGTTIYMVLMFWLGKWAYICWKQGSMPLDYYLFFWAFFIFFMVMNFFESYLFYRTGILIWTLVVSVLTAFIWQHRWGQRS